MSCYSCVCYRCWALRNVCAFLSVEVILNTRCWAVQTMLSKGGGQAAAAAALGEGTQVRACCVAVVLLVLRGMKDVSRSIWQAHEDVQRRAGRSVRSRAGGQATAAWGGGTQVRA
jgi:hypothetical protein